MCPHVPRIPRSAEEKDRWSRVVVVLDGCSLELGNPDTRSLQTFRHPSGSKVHKYRRKGLSFPSNAFKAPVLLDCRSASHRAYIRHVLNDTEVNKYRPDVIHQSLLQLLNSALSLSSHLEIFLRTSRGILIRIDPQLQCPLDIDEFNLMITEVLLNYKVRPPSTATKDLKDQGLERPMNLPFSLLRVVKASLFQHVPLYRIPYPNASSNPSEDHSIFIAREKKGMPLSGIHIFSPLKETPITPLLDYIRQFAPITAFSLSKTSGKTQQVENLHVSKSNGRKNSVTRRGSTTLCLEPSPKPTEDLIQASSTSDYPSELPIAPILVIGGFANVGAIDEEYWKKQAQARGGEIQWVKLAQETLSASRCCAMLTYAYERLLKL